MRTRSWFNIFFKQFPFCSNILRTRSMCSSFFWNDGIVLLKFRSFSRKNDRSPGTTPSPRHVSGFLICAILLQPRSLYGWDWSQTNNLKRLETGLNWNLLVFLKETVYGVFSSDPPGKEHNARFTTVIFKQRLLFIE